MGIKKRHIIYLLGIVFTLFFGACGKVQIETSNHIQNAVSLVDEDMNTSKLSDTGVDNNEDARYKDPSLSANERAVDLLSYMTLDEKVGQLIIGSTDYTLEGVRVNQIGGIVSKALLNNSDSYNSNDAQEWVDRSLSIQKMTDDTRMQIPLLIGTEAIHGNNYVSGATIFPHNIGLGASHDLELVNRIGEITKIELINAGLNWNLTPVLSYSNDLRDNETYQSYGYDMNLVKEMSKSYIDGFSLDKDEYKVITAVSQKLTQKYNNEGDSLDTNVNDDTSYSYVDLLSQYKFVIQNGTKAIYVANNKINNKLISTNQNFIQMQLKENMHFTGVVIADIDNNHEQIDELKLKDMLNAGIDMLIIPEKYGDYKNAITNLVGDGLISSKRIDDAVIRILSLKFEMGFFDQSNSNFNKTNHIGSLENREVAREAVRKSLVLLKNNDDIIAKLKDMKKILIAGIAADSIDYQCGPYSISIDEITKGQVIGSTLLESVKSYHNKKIKYTKDGSKTYPADVCLVVVSEKPYSVGDETYNKSKDLLLDKESRKLIKNVKKNNPNVPIVLLLYSGRPLVMNKEIDMVDALVAAWYPGTEGEGITDVLFDNYDFQGTLSYPWPKNSEQTDYLFDVGYGLKKGME